MSNMNSANQIKVPRRILGSLLSSVSAGVVPRAGAPYIALSLIHISEPTRPY